MSEYTIIARVDQIVTKEVKLLVEAGSEEQAEAKAYEALQDYPQGVDTPGVRRMASMQSHYWIPRNIEIKDIRKENGTG